MIMRLNFNFFNRFQIRLYHKLFVRYPPKEPNMMSFEFIYPIDESCNYKKHFSFYRFKNEEISSFLSRIKIKVNVEFEKIIKKKLKKNPNIISLSEYILNEVSVKDNLASKIIKNDDLIGEFFSNNTILQLNTTEYITIINCPTILSIKLPKINISNCPMIPIVHLEHGQLSDIRFEWFVSFDSCKWKSVHQGLLYTPSDDYVGYFVKVVSSCDKSEQCLEAQSKTIIIKCPEQISLKRRWQLTPTFVKEHDTLRLMTYNILADMYAESKLAREEIFRHCNEKWLAMDYRLPLLFNEVLKYRCDIVCLQEVDYHLFESFWQPAMYDIGYNGLFNVKNGTAEGQAIFWKQEKFKLIKNISLPSLTDYVLNDNIKNLSSIRDLIRSSSEELERWIGLKQGMVGCVLEAQGDLNYQLIVANTHLYFQPDAQSLRLFQMGAITCELDRLKVEYPLARVIICGDFNDFKQSPILDFIKDGFIDISCSQESIRLSHNHKLKSAYNADFTNYTLDFKAELDFIFYDQNSLRCEMTIPLPSLNEVTENEALPNEHFPSDHLALVAQFKIV